MVQSTIRNMVVVGVVAALTLPGCVAAGKYYELEDELAATQEELDYAQRQLADAEGLLQGAQGQSDELYAARQRALEAEQEAAEMREAMSSMQGQNALFSGAGVEVIYNKSTGEAGFRAEGDVVFVSGSDALTGEGKKALDLIVGRLIDLNRPVRIDGHTDIDPINKTKDKFPLGNIQLGARRAMSVRQYLIEKGLPEEFISIASYGPYRPVRSGSSAADKKANRRVEIMVSRPPSDEGAQG